MVKCEICGKEFLSKQSYGGHISSHRRGESYKKSRQTDKSKERRKSSNTCKYCGTIFEKSSSIGAHVISCKLNPKRELWIQSRSKNRPPLSEEHKKKVSESMKKAHAEKRAWNIGKSRSNNKMSYPEEFFTLVIENEFIDKNYIHEYPIGIYSLDFAWLSKKRCIEIDGEQHKRFEEYVERDKRKDEYLRENDWELLRIQWKEMYRNPKEKIKEAYDFIHNNLVAQEEPWLLTGRLQL